jgi:hypothetical protein
MGAVNKTWFQLQCGSQSFLSKVSALRLVCYALQLEPRLANIRGQVQVPLHRVCLGHNSFWVFATNWGVVNYCAHYGTFMDQSTHCCEGHRIVQTSRRACIMELHMHCLGVGGGEGGEG